MKGFTLLEVLAALAVIAIALAAGLRALGQAAASSEELRLRTLAAWVAQDRLALHRARASGPAPGIATGEATQAGHAFLWSERVASRSDGLSTVEVSVSPAGEPRRVLARLTGVLLASPQPP